MEQLLQTIVTQLPNLGVAVWMLYQQQMTIKSLLDNQTRLIDRLLQYVDQDKIAVRQGYLAAPPVSAPNGK